MAEYLDPGGDGDCLAWILRADEPGVDLPEGIWFEWRDHLEPCAVEDAEAILFLYHPERNVTTHIAAVERRSENMDDVVLVQKCSALGVYRSTVGEAVRGFQPSREDPGTEVFGMDPIRYEHPRAFRWKPESPLYDIVRRSYPDVPAVTPSPARPRRGARR